VQITFTATLLSGTVRTASNTFETPTRRRGAEVASDMQTCRRTCHDARTLVNQSTMPSRARARLPRQQTRRRLRILPRYVDRRPDVHSRISSPACNYAIEVGRSFHTARQNRRLESSSPPPPPRGRHIVHRRAAGGRPVAGSRSAAHGPPWRRRPGPARPADNNHARSLAPPRTDGHRKVEFFTAINISSVVRATTDLQPAPPPPPI